MNTAEVLLPEMQEEVIKRLPVKDLLTCRLVSRFWRSTATVICRQRHVFLKSATSHSTLGEKLHDLYSTFEETDVIPWSGCRLEFSDDMHVEDIFFYLDEFNLLEPMTLSDLQTFLDHFGTRILKLSVGGRHPNNKFFTLLKGMSNLEVLNFNSFFPVDERILHERIPLQRLQYLEIYLYSPDDSVTLLDFLMDGAPGIKYVNINFGDDWPYDLYPHERMEEGARRLVELISEIPFISFQTDTEGHGTWIPTALEKFAALKLTELDFTVPCEWSEKEGDVREYYRVFGLILRNSVERLQSLDIRVANPWNPEMKEPGGARLQIPTLPKLKRLGLYGDESIPRRNNLCAQLEPFTSNQFPNLETLVVWEDSGTYDVFNLAHFDSVSELIVSSGSAGSSNPNRMGPIWNQICPNAKVSVGEMRSQPNPEYTRCRLDEDFWYLYAELAQEGMFEPAYLDNFLRVLEIIGIALLGYFCLFAGSYLVKFFGVVLIALAQGRSGWMQDESCHPSPTGKHNADRCLHDVILGIGLRLSSTWWAGGRNRHHAMSQRLKHDVDLDAAIAYTAKVVANGKQGKTLLIQNQAYLLLGTLAWQFYVHPRYVIKHGYYFKLFCMTAHYVLAWQIGFWPWLLSTWLMSIHLFGNFALSHSHLPVTEEPAHWVQYSLRHTADVSPTPIVNWFMGYLNLQIEHHLFPSMPQCRLPHIRPRVRALAEKYNLPYVVHSFPEAVQKTFENFNSVSYQLRHS